MQNDVMRSVWEKAREAVREHLPESVYHMWIDPLQFIRFQDGRIILSTPHPFSRKWILDHYRDLLVTSLMDTARQPLDLEIEVAPPDPRQQREFESSRQQKIFPESVAKTQRGHYFKRDYTFDSFVVGNCNDFAYTATLSLASKKNRQQNVLYLCSKTGLGKSHLSQAVGQFILAEHPEDKVYYMTAEDFTDEMVNALKSNSINQFKKKYREGCDVLLLEDVQNLSGREKTQSELGLALDYLIDADKRLIFTSSHRPGDIPRLHDGVCSRLSSGLVLSMDKPDFRMRVRILKRKARQYGVRLSQEVIEYLASELTDNVRQLEAGLKNVAARGNLMCGEIDVAEAERVVSNLINAQREITLGSIKNMVCRYYRLTPEEIVSKSRKVAIVRPRQIAMYLSRRYTEQSLQAIGRSFKRQHATTLHACATVERHLRDKDQVARQVELLCDRIESGEL
ncbi:MAG: chromosomal replication initiator protein DnaA [Desulfatibacillaceae bacterium]